MLKVLGDRASQMEEVWELAFFSRYEGSYWYHSSFISNMIQDTAVLQGGPKNRTVFEIR